MPQASLYIYIYKDSHSGAMVWWYKFALLFMIVTLLLMERIQDIPFHIGIFPPDVDILDYYN